MTSRIHDSLQPTPSHAIRGNDKPKPWHGIAAAISILAATTLGAICVNGIGGALFFTAATASYGLSMETLLPAALTVFCGLAAIFSAIGVHHFSKKAHTQLKSR